MTRPARSAWCAISNTSSRRNRAAGARLAGAGCRGSEQILQGLEEGQGQPADLEQLRSHARLLGPGHTFCALAPGAAEPLQSGLKYFADDFERHIREKRCPWR